MFWAYLGDQLSFQTKKAYMDDATWSKVVEVLAPAIRKLPVIRDHPDWWCILTYDGLKSHVNVTKAL